MLDRFHKLAEIVAAFAIVRETIGQDSGRRQAMAFVTVTMNTVENQYRQFLDGNMSQEEWFNFKNGLIANMSSIETYAEYWQDARHIHSPKYAELVDELFLVAAERTQLFVEGFGSAKDS